jgi:hypothetical protein
MKITPYISKELHKDLVSHKIYFFYRCCLTKWIDFQRQEYVKYAKIIPLARWFNVKIPSKWYRRIVGGLEIVCGIALTFIPHSKPSLHCYTIYRPI